MRYDEGLCYYHLLNRVAGEPDFLPFGDVEKERFFKLVLRLSKLYCLELISVVVMSNHFHIVCAAPAEKPDVKQIRKRWKAFYGRRKVEPNWNDPEVVEAWATRLRDISWFMKDLQQRFTCWFNRTRPNGRRGRLWADRYKNVILESGRAVWDCVRYVEMNPVRAGVCAAPADYRFSTWGRFAGRGRHPFAESAARHLRPYLHLFMGDRAAELSDIEVLAELNADIARVAASEQDATPEEITAAREAARKGSGFVLTVRRRIRYWSDGAIIGSKVFVRDIASNLVNPERVEKKRLAAAREGNGGRIAGLYSWRFLRIKS
jgi:REP element-mobilizing transposase RayT